MEIPIPGKVFILKRSQDNGLIFDVKEEPGALRILGRSKDIILLCGTLKLNIEWQERSRGMVIAKALIRFLQTAY